MDTREAEQVKEKLNAVVKEINGPQVHVVAEGERFFLQGITRPQDVHVGDKGKMVYRTSASSGLWFFEKEGTKLCAECGKEWYAYCSFCTKVLCYSCLHKHVPTCEDYLKFEAKMIVEGRWKKEEVGGQR